VNHPKGIVASIRGKGILLVLLAMATVVCAVFGSLIGLAFGKMLLGAAIGAMVPIVWCVLAFCFLKALDIIFRGQWG